MNRCGSLVNWGIRIILLIIIIPIVAFFISPLIGIKNPIAIFFVLLGFAIMVLFIFGAHYLNKQNLSHLAIMRIFLTFCIILLLIAIFTGIMGTLKIIDNTNSKSWESTEGKITLSEIRTRSSSGTSNSIVYFPSVKYDYYINNIKYTGNRISLLVDIKLSDISYAEKILENYKVNQTVAVFYNPNNPQEAVLDLEVKKASLLIYLVIIVIFGFSGAYGIWKYKKVVSTNKLIMKNGKK